MRSGQWCGTKKLQVVLCINYNVTKNSLHLDLFQFLSKCPYSSYVADSLLRNLKINISIKYFQQTMN